MSITYPVPGGTGTYTVASSTNAKIPYLSTTQVKNVFHIIQLLSLMFSGKIVRYVNHASPRLSKLLPKKTAEEYIAQNIPPFLDGQTIFDDTGNLKNANLPKEVLRWYRAKSVEDEFIIDMPQTAIEAEEAIQWLKGPDGTCSVTPSYPYGTIPSTIPMQPAQPAQPLQPIWITPSPSITPILPMQPGITYTVCATDTDSSK